MSVSLFDVLHLSCVGFVLWFTSGHMFGQVVSISFDLIATRVSKRIFLIRMLYYFGLEFSYFCRFFFYDHKILDLKFMLA